MFGMDDMFRKADERQAELKQEFERRAADMPPMPIPGDKVILHAGLMQRGQMWARIEGKCTAIAENSVRVEFLRYDKEVIEEWVHPAVIVDILKRSPTAEVGAE